MDIPPSASGDIAQAAVINSLVPSSTTAAGNRSEDPTRSSSMKPAASNLRSSDEHARPQTSYRPATSSLPISHMHESETIKNWRQAPQPQAFPQPTKESHHKHKQQVAQGKQSSDMEMTVLAKILSKLGNFEAQFDSRFALMQATQRAQVCTPPVFQLTFKAPTKCRYKA